MKTREILREIKTSDGLPSNDVYGLVRDSLDRVWVSTGNGLCIVWDSAISSLNYINGIAGNTISHLLQEQKMAILYLGAPQAQ